MSTLVVYLILLTKQLNLALSNSEWNYKFSFTKQINSQVTIDCGLADQIWIGWSHYGTRNVNNVASANGNNVKSRNNQEVNLNYL
jgi:hypothetical protein